MANKRGRYQQYERSGSKGGNKYNSQAVTNKKQEEPPSEDEDEIPMSGPDAYATLLRSLAQSAPAGSEAGEALKRCVTASTYDKQLTLTDWNCLTLTVYGLMFVYV